MAVERLELERRPPLTVDEFGVLARQEGWGEDTRVELLDGELVWMNPVNDPHVGCVIRLTQLFGRRLADDQVLVSVQNPIRLDEYDLPQPDVALLRPRPDYYATGKPEACDVLLLVEVSDTTLRTDLGRKARIYAGAGVAEYWVIDVGTRSLYVHRSPLDGRYQHREMLTSSEIVQPDFAPDLAFRVVDLTG
jgi:Uma2 family endonuclease